MPFLDTAELLQGKPHGCGETAFAILWKYHYARKPLPDWSEIADPVRGLGAGTLELFVKKSFGCYLAGHLDLDRLRVFAGFTPVVCIRRLSSELDHWTVVRGVGRKRVATQDPEGGRKEYAHDEWLADWTDAAEGGVYRRWAITGWPE